MCNPDAPKKMKLTLLRGRSQALHVKGDVPISNSTGGVIPSDTSNHYPRAQQKQRGICFPFLACFAAITRQAPSKANKDTTTWKYSFLRTIPGRLADLQKIRKFRMNELDLYRMFSNDLRRSTSE